ncbi:MAG: HAMP domain-containing sensor histidine kinase [bacterium]|nr:HAMP domain-containing sensor histidine kinase [bacterium]
MRADTKKQDKTTERIRLYILIASGFAAFTLVLLPQLIDYDYPNHIEVALLLSATFFVSILGYALSRFYPKRSFDIANYEFVFYIISVGMTIHYIDYLNGSLIFMYGLVLLAAAYFMNARNLAYLSGLASILVITEYFFLVNNEVVEFTIIGFAFVLLRILYIALLAQVGKNLGLDLSTQRKEHAKLTQLNKELSEIDKVKSEFIDVASHQLKTPLTVIKGNTSMMLEGDYGKVNKDLMMPLKEVDIGAQRLTDIINDVVDTLKYEEGLPITLNVELTDLKKIITYEMYSFVSDSWAKDVKIDLKTSDDVPKTYVDPEKIKLALSIYLENAVSHSLRGGKVEIVLKETKGKVVVEVIDNGPQIAEVAPEKIFRRFSREHKEKEKLTLNLYVVKRIIDSHKGKTYYKTAENGGNVFGFELPIDKIAKKNRKRIKA